MKDNIQEQLRLLEEMKRGIGIVRSEEQIQDDLDREFQERMRKQAEQEEQERLYKERLEREQEEQRQRQYNEHKDIFDFMKVFNELEVDDYYCIVELKDGRQFTASPGELRRDTEYLMFYILRKVERQSMFESPYRTILEVNINEIKGIKLVPEEQREITIIKKSKFGKFEE